MIKKLALLIFGIVVGLMVGYTTDAYALSVFQSVQGGTGNAGTITGLVKANGVNPYTAAAGDTDYQNPITLTTSGSSGAATFSGDVLNIPQYTGGGSLAFSYPFPNNATTSSIAFGGLTITGAGTGCATFTGGVLSSTGIACGSGSGSVGNWFTPTSYGNATSTTVGFLNGLISNGSTTIAGLTSGNVGNNNGKLYGIPTTTVTCTGNATCTTFSVNGGTPITINVAAGTAASSTLLGDTNTFSGTGNQFTHTLTVAGMLDTASTTINAALGLPSLAQGVTYIGSGNILQSVGASSSIFGFTPASNAVTVTIAGTANQISSSNSSAQALSGNVSSTLSFPNLVVFPSNASSTLFSSTYASTTTFIVSGQTGCGQFSAAGILTGTGSNCGTGGTGASYPFTVSSTFGQTAQATTGIPWFQNGFTASSTSWINTLNLTNALSPANGGTGLVNPGSPTVGSLVQFNGNTAANAIAPGPQYTVVQSTAGGSGFTVDAVHLNQSAAITGTLPYSNGGTGTTTGSIGQLNYYGGTAYQSVGTTTVACSGSASCTPFVVLSTAANPGPFTITASGSGASFGYPFPNTDINFGNTANATSTVVGFTAGILASSTSQFSNSSTTLATIGTLFLPFTNTTCLGTDTTGKVFNNNCVTQILVNGTSNFGSVSLSTSTYSFNGLTISPLITGSGGNLTLTGSIAGSLNLAGLSAIAANSVIGNNTANSAVPTALSTTTTNNIGLSPRLATWTVAAHGGDFTTIQAALNACGSANGGTIYLTDSSYTISSTLTFAGPSCRLIGNGVGSTTLINFDGAVVTTALKTGGTGFSNEDVENIDFNQVDGNQGTCLDASNMAENIYHNDQFLSCGTAIRINDTQNFTFYNDFDDLYIFSTTTTPGGQYGINASSTDPIVFNIFKNIRVGLHSSSANQAICYNLDNFQAGTFINADCEPADSTNVIGVKIFADSLSTNHGTFGNIFQGLYEESTTIGVQASSTVGSAIVQNNNFYGGQIAQSSNTNILDASSGATNVHFVGVGLNNTTELTNFGSLGIATSTPGTIFSLGNVGGINFTTAATTTFGSSVNGVNITNGCFAVKGTCVSGGAGGGVTSVGLSLPTGFTITNSPVTTSGTLTATLNTGFSVKELPSWTVCSSGCDFTTIQAGLNAAGTAGGGTIYLTDAVYNDGTTGLLIKSSNTTITSNASTTINFTGATTLFKTNAAASQFSNITISNLVITGDNTTGGVAINTSDMTHSHYTNNTISTVDTCFVANDTQNVTFYNRLEDNNCTFKSIGLNASSTNAWNADVVEGNFFGAQTAGGIGIQMTNANGDAITNNRIESAAVNTTIDIYLFDNNIATCNGIFNNTFSGNYLESGKATNSTAGIRFGASLCPSTKIYNNQLSNNIVENHQFDFVFAATTTQIGLQNWFGNIDSNFGNSLTSFTDSLGVGTSSELQAIGNTLLPALAVSASSSVNSNDVLVEHTGAGGSDNTDFRITTAGAAFAPNTVNSSANQTGYWCYDANGQLIRDTIVCIAVSARRFKEDIQYNVPGLSELMQLQPISYKLKPDYNTLFADNPNYNGVQYSLVADDVQKVDPRLVTVETATTTFEGVTYPPGTVHGLSSYENWVALFTESIQEQQKEIVALEKATPAAEKSVEDYWQWAAIEVLALYVVYNEWGKRRKK